MINVPGVVLDSSAFLAVLHGEPGGDVVEARLHQAAMSSVNWAEVVQKALARGLTMRNLEQDFRKYGLSIIPFTAEDAEMTAQLWAPTRHRGLSLGDRACLATGLRLGLPVLTGDRSWSGLDLGVQVHLFR